MLTWPQRTMTKTTYDRGKTQQDKEVNLGENRLGVVRNSQSDQTTWPQQYQRAVTGDETGNSRRWKKTRQRLADPGA